MKNIYKQGEKRKKDEAEEKREMARIEQAASAAYATDVGAGRAGPSSAAASSSTSPAPARKVHPIAAPSTGVLSSHVKPSAANKAPPPPVAKTHNLTIVATLHLVLHNPIHNYYSELAITRSQTILFFI